MKLSPGATRYGRFTVIDPYTGELANAASTPTIAVERNGASVSPTVTVTNPATGEYRFSYTVNAGYTADDVMTEVASYTVGGLARKEPVGAYTIDNTVASRSTYAGGAVASVTGNVGGNVVGSVASVTGAVGSVTGNVGGNVVGSVASISGVTFPTGFNTLTVGNIQSGLMTSAAYTAPNNAAIADINNRLPATPASQGDVQTAATAAAAAKTAAESADGKLSAGVLAKINGAQQAGEAVELPTTPPEGYGGGGEGTTRNITITPKANVRVTTN